LSVVLQTSLLLFLDLEIWLQVLGFKSRDLVQRIDNKLAA